MKFLQDCRESIILEYYGTDYGTKCKGLEALYLYFSPYEINDFGKGLQDKIKKTIQVEEKYDFNLDDVLGETSQGFSFRNLLHCK